MHTIDQHQLVSLLFEGILQSIATARGALARGDIAAKCAAVAKALRILEEGLMTALDREAGGELAANLGAVGSGNDLSCLSATKQNSTPAGLPWLRSQNGSCASTNDRDPSARASFGIYSSESKKTVHIRELY